MNSDEKVKYARKRLTEAKVQIEGLLKKHSGYRMFGAAVFDSVEKIVADYIDDMLEKLGDEESEESP